MPPAPRTREYKKLVLSLSSVLYLTGHLLTEYKQVSRGRKSSRPPLSSRLGFASWRCGLGKVGWVTLHEAICYTHHIPVGGWQGSSGLLTPGPRVLCSHHLSQRLPVASAEGEGLHLAMKGSRPRGLMSLLILLWPGLVT